MKKLPRKVKWILVRFIFGRKRDLDSVKQVLSYVWRFLLDKRGCCHSVFTLSTTPLSPHPPPPSVEAVMVAKKLMIKDAQRRHFGPEDDASKEGNSRQVKRVLIRSPSVIWRPFVDKERPL